MSGVNKASTASERRKKKSCGENENGNVAADEKQTEEKCTLNSSKMEIAAVLLLQWLSTCTHSLVLFCLWLFGGSFCLAANTEKDIDASSFFLRAAKLSCNFRRTTKTFRWNEAHAIFSFFFLLLFVIPLPVAILWFSVCLQLMIALTRDIKTARAKRRHRQQQP